MLFIDSRGLLCVVMHACWSVLGCVVVCLCTSIEFDGCTGRYCCMFCGGYVDR